jgi:hypothetical protein
LGKHEDIESKESFNEVDHSKNLAADFSTFLFDEKLADIKVEVRSARFVEKSSDQSSKNEEFTVISAHKIVLASRCPYFNSNFSHPWADNSPPTARFPHFTETPMRAFLRYLYTGKLSIEVATVMGVMKISSYFNMEELVKACKEYLTGKHLSAFDLCHLYCEVRDECDDFDDMRGFLT